MNRGEDRDTLIGRPCGAISPDRSFMCDQPVGHECDHEGPELPTVVIDERATS